MLGELKPDHGSIKWAEKAKLGYYAQDHSAEFDSDESLTDWISGYIREGGYEPTMSRVGPPSETAMKTAIRELLKVPLSQ